ncbi:hypothetical protein [Rossellomorea vietnamensis]|uniref:hypothetical protein n=1 Tax=Rossellomorea vietnamensis TaxID=218284 RepID=UPI003CEFE3EA
MNKSASALVSPDRQMFLREKKAVFLLFSQGYLIPRSWALKLDEQKRKRPGQPRQANVPERKKGGFPFILSGLFDPEA